MSLSDLNNHCGTQLNFCNIYRQIISLSTEGLHNGQTCNSSAPCIYRVNTGPTAANGPLPSLISNTKPKTSFNMLPVSPQTEFMFIFIYCGLLHHCFKAFMQLNTDYPAVSGCFNSESVNFLLNFFAWEVFSSMNDDDEDDDHNLNVCNII